MNLKWTFFSTVYNNFSLPEECGKVKETFENGKHIWNISYAWNAIYSKRFNKLLTIKTWSGMACTTNKLRPVNLNGNHMDTRPYEIYCVWKQKYESNENRAGARMRAIDEYRKMR